MDRLVALALLLSLVVPLGPTEAQQTQRVYRVGVLNFGSSTPNPLTYPLNSSMAQRLADLGFREGQNLVLERRWADANFERVEPLTIELTQARVDLIVTVGNKLGELVTRANPRIPMVLLSCDAHAMVASYAKPNGNFTGVTCMSTELSPKRLEFAKQLVPGAKRVVYLHNPNQGAIGLELTLKAAAQLGLTVRAVEMRSPAERDQAFAAIAADRPDVLLVYPDAVTFLSRKEIAEFALAQRLPSVYAYVHYAEAGGLLSYGSTLTELGERAGELAARILRGAKPSDLPIEQATRVSLTINMKTARAIGHAVPPQLLERAERVIE
jgi:putative ABC transport system substrate-binding protein